MCALSRPSQPSDMPVFSRSHTEGLHAPPSFYGACLQVYRESAAAVYRTPPRRVPCITSVAKCIECSRMILYEVIQQRREQLLFRFECCCDDAATTAALLLSDSSSIVLPYEYTSMIYMSHGLSLYTFIRNVFVLCLYISRRLRTWSTAVNT